jgi:predicted transcriptional regulator
MNETSSAHITVAPTLADAKTLVIYRDNGEEVVVKITDKGTLASEKKLSLEEVNFIKENYL